MPCRDSRDNDYCFSMKDIENVVNSIRDELEPLLCEACSALEDAKLLPGQLSPELLIWYENHSKYEEERVRYEAALKLSERERRLFGIDLESLKIKVKFKGQIK